MKKIISVILLICVASTFLFGCGDDSEKETKDPGSTSLSNSASPDVLGSDEPDVPDTTDAPSATVTDGGSTSAPSTSKPNATKAPVATSGNITNVSKVFPKNPDETNIIDDARLGYKLE